MTATQEITIETKKPTPPRKPKHEIANFLPGVLSGMIDAHPKDFTGQIGLSFRGNTQVLSVNETIHFLQQHCDAISESPDVRVGLSFLELRPRGTSMPFTSFVEFLVLAYASLHAFASACSATHRPKRWSSLRKGNPSIQVPWIYIPTRNVNDIGHVHSMVADAVLRASSTNHLTTTKFFGYEANDDRTRNQLEQPSDILTAHQKIAAPVRYQEMIATADAMLSLSSSHVLKEWPDLEEFPFEEWQNDVEKALESLTPLIAKNNKTVVCYLDQQNDRHFKLPDVYHKLLKQHFSLHRQVDFHVIRIESSDNTLDLLYLRAQCPVWMGSSSPLFSSISLFLAKGARIIEHGWDHQQSFTRLIANGLNYEYLRVFRGQVGDTHVTDPQFDEERMKQIMLHGFESLEDFLGISPLRVQINHG